MPKLYIYPASLALARMVSRRKSASARIPCRSDAECLLKPMNQRQKRRRIAAVFVVEQRLDCC